MSNSTFRGFSGPWGGGGGVGAAFSSAAGWATTGASSWAASAAGSGWGGDEVVYLEDDSGRDAVVVATVWDTEEDADTFRAAVEAWFRKRFPKGTLEQDASGGFSVADAGKLYAVSREGQSLVCVLGLPAADGRRWQGR